MGGIDMVHVPYKGGAAALTATLSGQVLVNFSGINLARQYVAQGKLRAIAVTSTARSRYMPDTPTVAETPGFEGYEASVPFAVWAPAAKVRPPREAGRSRKRAAAARRSPRG